MENKKFKKNTIIAIFKRVTNEEKEVALQHEVELLNVNAHVPNKSTLSKWRNVLWVGHKSELQSYYQTRKSNKKQNVESKR
jgi:hypothetical protein